MCDTACCVHPWKVLTHFRLPDLNTLVACQNHTGSVFATAVSFPVITGILVITSHHLCFTMKLGPQALRQVLCQPITSVMSSLLESGPWMVQVEMEDSRAGIAYMPNMAQLPGAAHLCALASLLFGQSKVSKDLTITRLVPEELSQRYSFSCQPLPDVECKPWPSRRLTQQQLCFSFCEPFNECCLLWRVLCMAGCEQRSSLCKTLT